MKATLEFNLPEESAEHTAAVNGWKYQAILDEIFNLIRRQDKLGKSSIDLEKLRMEIVEIREGHGIYE